MGTGPEYILLALNNPLAVENKLQLRERGGTCTEVSAALEMEKTIVVFLIHEKDGAYRWRDFTSGLYSFDEPDGLTSVFYRYPKSDSESPWREFSFSELQTYILERTRQQTIQPDKTQPYPTTQPILLTLNDGSKYVLPVDSGAPVLMTEKEMLTYLLPSGCSSPPCWASSPNGLDAARLVSDTSQIQPGDGNGSNLLFQGDAILFSPTSDAIAFWNGKTIEVYALFYPRLGFWEQRQLVNSITLDLVSGGYFEPGLAAWSPDGRLLAYSDRRGLWLWDVFTTGSLPRLLLPRQNNVPYARHFSPAGRYLAITEGSQRYYIDLVNGDRFPDGLISPDDRILFAFDTTVTGEFDMTVQQLVFPGQSQASDFSPLQSVQWIDSNRFLIALCRPGYYQEDGPWVDDPWCGVTDYYSFSSFGDQKWYPGFKFDYSFITDSVATVVDDTTISINGAEQKVTLPPGKAIVDIQWLRPLFYYD
ncbi:MAG TPA: hypothetical protein VHO69_13455 [Phototrophicaceae bacterium]|nr:hypothetical protein [Phototrophicaceae bacterium]